MTPEEFATAPLSAVIRAALVDLEKVEQDDRYVVDMTAWHSTLDRRCHVCIAGAVMAGTLGISRNQDASPGIFEARTHDRLSALNDFRRGVVRRAALGFAPRWVELVDIPEFVHVPRYSRDPAGFKAALAGIAVILEERGL